MVIERYADDDMVPVYRRLRDAGRGVDGSLRFVGSWVEAGSDTAPLVEALLDE